MLNPSDKECGRENATLMDVAPTVLDILGIEGEFGIEGESIFKHKHE
jgi:bisphosphoglycerate-independent phosphoglycerate mutase (AlkP superfamily)